MGRQGMRPIAVRRQAGAGNGRLGRLLERHRQVHALLGRDQAAMLLQPHVDFQPIDLAAGDASDFFRRCGPVGYDIRVIMQLCATLLCLPERRSSAWQQRQDERDDIDDHLERNGRPRGAADPRQ